MTLKENKNERYSIDINNNNLFKWIIKYEKFKNPLIMDFSEPPEYNLYSITKFENTPLNLLNNDDYFIDIKDIKIDLKEEISNLYEKIALFLDEIRYNFTLTIDKNPCCPEICFII